MQININDHLDQINETDFDSVLVRYEEEEDEISKEDFIKTLEEDKGVFLFFAENCPISFDDDSWSMFDEGCFYAEDYQIQNRVLIIDYGWEK